MEAKGTLRQVECAEGELLITLSVDKYYFSQAARLMADDIDVRIEKHREARSLSANAYLWVLIDKIARLIGSDKDSVYLLQLRRYGCFTDIVVKQEAVDQLRKYYRLIEQVYCREDGFAAFRCYYGSSTYNTKEMSELLDGTVGDAKDLGIEVLDPNEIAALETAWEARERH